MKSHTGQRDFECMICGKRFLYSYNVSAHIRHVHFKEKRKKYEEKKSCLICNKKFYSNNKLRDHLRNEHNFVEMPEELIAGDPDIVHYTTEEVYEQNE